ncbi:MAG: hypothetical protein JKY45_04250 [Emcibacter sp.]|nr:hypothetical protein [Emcibacter sp.]
MTLIEAILARASGRETVKPGDVVVANVDRMIMHDLSGYVTSKVFDEKVGLPIANPDRIVMVFDHLFSPPSETEAEVLQADRAWARKHGINLLDCGNGNIHNAVVHNGFIGPGMVVVGSDSHTPVHGAMGAFAVALGNDSHAGTVLPYSKAWFKVPETIRIDLHGTLQPGTTPRDVALWLVSQIGEGGAIYKAIELGGPLVEEMSLFDRWLLTLITVDLGAKCGYVDPDEKVFKFAREHNAMQAWDEMEVSPVSERKYEKRLEFDVSDLAPQVACSPTVGNVKTVDKVAGTTIQYAELGGHAGGRIEDLRVAAEVFKGKRVHPEVCLNIVPSSRVAFAQALEEGIVAQLHEAGAMWFPPSTGSNQAVNMGAMAAGDAMISTHSRNFPSRNGSIDAAMYLASSHTVSASAIAGCITDIREVL